MPLPPGLAKPHRILALIPIVIALVLVFAGAGFLVQYFVQGSLSPNPAPATANMASAGQPGAPQS